MSKKSNQPGIILVLILIAAVPRVLGAFFLPNAFGDAYVYIRDIGVLSTKLSQHTFSLSDLYGFWLPLYQFISAILNVFLDNGFYAGKLVAAAFGIGVCLLVYVITLQITAHRTAALLCFILIALNPLHIFYSASAMTDVPHACFVLASLYFALRRKWIWAAVFAALAGLTRMDSWMLLLLIPAIQYLRERRLSIPAILIMIVPPAFWFYISWLVTGDLFANFSARESYHKWLVNANPALAGFSLIGLLKDGGTFIISTDIAVLIAVSIAGWKMFRHPNQILNKKTNNDAKLSIVAPLLFFFAYFALLFVAYVTHQQPIIFPRYGLILFSLGIPVLAWTFLSLKAGDAQKAQKILLWLVAICVFDAGLELAESIGVIRQYSTERTVARYLQDNFRINGDTRIFSDDGTVNALSGIAPEKFVTSSDAPRDGEGFLDYIELSKVEYLIVTNKPDSTPSKYFSQLNFGESIGSYQSVFDAHSTFLPTNIRVYKYNNDKGDIDKVNSDNLNVPGQKVNPGPH